MKVYSSPNPTAVLLLKKEILHLTANPLFIDLELELKTDILEDLILTYCAFFTITNTEMQHIYYDFYNLKGLTKH